MPLELSLMQPFRKFCRSTHLDYFYRTARRSDGQSLTIEKQALAVFKFVLPTQNCVQFSLTFSVHEPIAGRDFGAETAADAFAAFVDDLDQWHGGEAGYWIWDK